MDPETAPIHESASWIQEMKASSLAAAVPATRDGLDGGTNGEQTRFIRPIHVQSMAYIHKRSKETQDGYETVSDLDSCMCTRKLAGLSRLSLR